MKALNMYAMSENKASFYGDLKRATSMVEIVYMDSSKIAFFAMVSVQAYMKVTVM
jgi:hypothetical protein